jgi:two-component system, sensor histidine kinase PdtaS
MKKICFLLLLPVQFVYGQQKVYDSLQQQLAVAKADTQRLRLLHQLSIATLGIDRRKALEIAKQGVTLAETTSDKNWQSKLYEVRGRMHANLMQLDSAQMFLTKAMEGYVAVNNKKGQATTSFLFSWVAKRKGAFEDAMASDLKALRIMEELNDKEGIASAYERLSDGLTRQGKFTEAMEYAKKSVETCERNNLRHQQVYALFNAGNVSIAMNNNTEALNYYNKSIDLARVLNFAPGSITPIINSRGNALKHLKQYQLALADYNTTLAQSKQTNFVQGISSAIANLGEVNMLMGNYKEALGYQLETVRLQEENKDVTNLTENYKHVATIYEKLGDYKKALAYERKSRGMRDSVASIKSDTAMSRLLTQYQTEKKEATIATQQNEIAQQKKIRWLSTGIAVLLAGFLVFGYRSFQNRNRSNRLLKAKNSENELLLKEIHHRVKNNLEVVSSLLALQSAQIDDPHTKEAMQEGQNRVHSIGIVHQKLYQGTNLGTIEMKDYFLNLSESILDSFGADKRVSVELAMEKTDVDIDTAVPLGLIVNELLTNILKYAFPQGQQGKIRIRLEKQPGGALHLEVSDNGVGKSGIVNGTGFGGQLVSLLTRQLSGSMREDLQHGTAVFFHFKPGKVA